MGDIYIFEGNFPKGEKGNDFLVSGGRKYGMEHKINMDDNELVVKRTEKGKPYFLNSSIKFSLSHTENLWMCLYDEKTCGIDLQIVKECKYDAISKKFFSEEEQHYVELWGLDGFFDIWVRKEAFGKYTGKGLFAEKSNFVSQGGELIESFIYNEKLLYMKKIEIGQDIKCVACIMDNDDIEMRLL